MVKPRILGAKARGASHKRDGTPCQDSYIYERLNDGTVILAVADGHGSKSSMHSDYGSKIAVNIFNYVMKDFLDRYVGNRGCLQEFLDSDEGKIEVAQTIDTQWKKLVRVAPMSSRIRRRMPPVKNRVANVAEIYQAYGTTLVGLMVNDSFLFAYQLGDGDIIRVDGDGSKRVLQGEEILGTETSSLSMKDSWKRAITVVRSRSTTRTMPYMFLLSTDGFANSHKNDQEFQKTCVEYFEMINQHGADAVASSLKGWLDETSELGCGDDTTVLIAYYSSPESEVAINERD